jgi:ATP-dependent DNA helicase RecQ
MMRSYAETRRCRPDFLLAYFGEEQEEPCGACDNCRDGLVTTTVAREDAPYPLQSAVRHDDFGTGTVTDVEDDRITVLFEDVGYRNLSLEVVAEQGLLERA